MNTDAEKSRLEQSRTRQAHWKKWGPYLSERQWGTVREDYSDNGDAWNYFTHDQARSRAYRWGEDGLAGVSDDHQVLCFALALWNGRDPILKERAFGLTNSEGNHGEDVKEYYFYLDSTPTHSYMKYLYKYPQATYPYDDLVQTNRRRGKHEPEYELLDTGVFDDDRYFDVFVEYAKAAPEDMLVRITVANRGPEAAPLHLLPTLWFRNTWSQKTGGSKPELKALAAAGHPVVHAHHTDALFQESLSDYYLHVDADVPLLFTDNETNHARLFGSHNTSPYVKDAFHNFLIHGDAAAINPAGMGTKVAAHQRVDIGAGQTQVLRLRLNTAAPKVDAFADFDAVFAQRLAEADAFYAALTPPGLDADRASVLRQALAGMLWTKQYFYYDLDLWLDEHGAGAHLPAQARKHVRNADWSHMFNDDIISMPDKWEYPWYAAWDLAFHMIPLGMVDPDFAKQQLDLMLRNDYLHPNGQLPAYEWNFGDVNPPVHAWATFQLYQLDKERRAGAGDIEFLKYAFSQAAGQLHLVGQPQGPHRCQRLRRRLPRPGQHRRVRPLGAAAHRRLPRPGRRHRLDGVLQPADAAHRGRVGAARAAVRGVRREVLPALAVHRRRAGPRGRPPRRDVGRGGRLLLRRAAPARRWRDAAEGALHRRPAAAVPAWRCSRKTSSTGCPTSASARRPSAAATRSWWPPCTCPRCPAWPTGA